MITYSQLMNWISNTGIMTLVLYGIAGLIVLSFLTACLCYDDERHTRRRSGGDPNLKQRYDAIV